MRKDKKEKTKEKPEGSIAGAGKELVGVLKEIMYTLKRKDEEGRKKGQPKKMLVCGSNRGGSPATEI